MSSKALFVRAYFEPKYIHVGDGYYRKYFVRYDGEIDNHMMRSPPPRNLLEFEPDHRVFVAGIATSFIAHGVPGYMAGAAWERQHSVAELTEWFDNFTPRKREEIPIFPEHLER